MAKQIVDFVNQNNLIWSRKKAGLTISQVYKKTGWSDSTGKIEKWESGDEYPTISELKKLGQVYKRAWTLFLMEKEINQLGFSTMRDYRGSIKNLGDDDRAEIIEFINELESRQGFLREFRDELGIKRKDFFGSLVNNKDVTFVANQIKKLLDINLEGFHREKTRQDAINYLQNELSKNNIFVCFSSNHHKKTIPLDIMRGVLVRSGDIPIIGINSNEKSKGARIFTIFHELVHLFTEKIEDEVLLDTIDFRDMEARPPKERFCDEVAAKILIPDEKLFSLKGKNITPNIVESICLELKINIVPFLIRAKESGLINQDDFDFLERTAREEKKKIVSTDKPNRGPDGGLIHVLKNGKNFINTVNSLYSEGSISYTQALSALDVKSSTFNRHVNK